MNALSPRTVRERIRSGFRDSFVAALLVLLVSQAVVAQTRVNDVFGRTLNKRGLTLVDWDGYMANPLIKFYLLPPTNAGLPGSAVLTASGVRLYFDSPGTVSAHGPSKSVFFNKQNIAVPVNISIFPDRDNIDEDYSLTIVFTGGNGLSQTNSIPIHVVDQDIERPNNFLVTANFDRDITGIFANATRRVLTVQAANDWSYFFDGMKLDPVSRGTESTSIWSNNFNGSYAFTNTNNYTGYLLYAYGTTNAVHRSGGEGSYSGGKQTSKGVPLPIKRSGGFESEILGNYNALGWLYLPSDDAWLATGNLGNETNDFYSIAHHEIGHALIFNQAHPGFSAARAAGKFSSAAVTNYFGGPVSIDGSDHLNGTIDPESGQGVFGYEYYGKIPRKRWIITKLDLLCAQEVGYVLRPTSAFASLAFPKQTLPQAFADKLYYAKLIASGGIPFYNWEIKAGILPAGLTLDSFTGVLSGTSVASGEYSFTVRVRDYHEMGATLEQYFILRIAEAPQVKLSISILGQLGDNQSCVTFQGAPNRQRVSQISSNLDVWTSFGTDSTALDSYQWIEKNLQQFSQRF
jgi:hypothetical protein